MDSTSHEPVLTDEIVDLLAVTDGPGLIVDATVGVGGHAVALLARSAGDVALVGFDRDADALDLARRRLAAYGERAVLVHAGYDELSDHVEPVVTQHGPLLGVLYDLGVSSMQLDRAERGFSFRADAPLDMRMDASSGPTAAELLDTIDEAELSRILHVYGEERFSRRIARAVMAARPVTSTAQLADIVAGAVPAAARRGPIHPATRTFQALRIALNDELQRFSASLPQALELAAPAAGSRGGRIAVLSYHSLEDRIAKRFFADAARGCICPPDFPVCACGREPLVRHLTRGAEQPDAAEIARNPRARSAKLRAIEKTSANPAQPPGE